MKFWSGMAKKTTLKDNDVVMLGNPETENPEYATYADLTKGFGKTYSQSTDPSLDTDKQVKNGDRWINGEIEKVRIGDRWINPVLVSTIFLDKKFGLTEYANIAVVQRAIKSLKLHGDWDASKIYRIRYITRNSSNYGYRLIIQETAIDGSRVADIYDTTFTSTLVEAGEGKYTRVVLPTINDRQVIIEVDYNELANGVNYDISSSNYVINPICITNDYSLSRVKVLETTTASNVATLEMLPFYDSKLKTASANQKLIAKAIKEIYLIGNFDHTKKYVIRSIGRNDATYKYRLIIEILNDDGTIGAVVFDSGYSVVTEAGSGKLTSFTFTQSASNDKVMMVIDYNILPDATFLSISGGNPYVVKSSNIRFSDLNNDVFVSRKFNKPSYAEHYEVYNAIKSLQLIGDFDNSAYYFVRYIIRKYSTPAIWRIIIDKLDKDGNITESGVYDGILQNVTEKSGGATFMDFGTKGKRQVIAEIDWNVLAIGVGISLQTRVPNYIINPLCIKTNSENIDLSSVEYKKQAELTNPAIDYLQENSVLGYSEPDYNNSKLALSSVPKKGFMSFRTDDNHILKEIVAIAEKFGYRYTMGVNLANLDYAGQEDHFRALQAKGHELADHTPNHNTLQVTIRNEWLSIFQPYVGNGIDRIIDLVAGQTSTVIFTKEYRTNYLDNQFGSTNAFQTVAGTNKITGDFSELRQLTSFPTFMSYIYIETINGNVKQGWNIVNTSTTEEITISDELGNPLNFATSENITVYIIQSQGYENDGSIKVTLTENATYLLLLAGQLWFQYRGLKRPTTWIQPGGDHPWMLNIYLEKAFDKLGMSWAETVDENRNLTYNFADKYENKRTGTWWDGAPLHMDYETQANLQLAKEKIADYIALKNIRAMASHYRWSSFTGSTDAEKKQAYITHMNNIFEFCHKNGVQFLTLSERKQMLLDAKTERGANIIPDLFSDMAGRNKPDGYVLGSGVTWDKTNGVPESKNHALKLSATAGNLFTIANLGAVEKGQNEISLFAKGNFTGTITVQNEAGANLLQETINSTSLEYAKFFKQFNVPLTVNYVKLIVSNNANSGDCYVTNLNLKGV